MPELPEVETTLRGISPHIKNQTALKVIIRQPKLRWLIPTELPQLIEQHTLQSLRRRAKYLLLNFDTGTLLIHLGMSGSLRVITDNTPVAKHDHFDIQFTNNKSIRLTDPRRFGAVLWLGTDPESHPLLSKLGPEPLGTEITANYLYQKSRSKKVRIKQFLRGVAIFAKACFGHPSPSKRQKLNATTNAFGAPDVLRTCHFAITIVNSVLAS
ncbi:hypothetical protein BMR02_05405 [Methylococcaceae bacterium HT1]|nr:hypothetical protein BMR02_05405 [Methylococcaceae bacterium HT1]